MPEPIERSEPVEPPTSPARSEASEPPVPLSADPVLLAAVDLARAALGEITPPATVGEPVGHTVEGEHVVSLHFATRLAGYPGWHWTVSLARTGDDAEASVLETELMPGEAALLAPAWVPWAERMADYRAAQEAASIERGEDSGDDAEADDFDGELDETDDDLDDGYDDEPDDESADEDEDAELDPDEAFDGIDIDALDDEESDAEESDDEDSDDGDQLVGEPER